MNSARSPSRAKALALKTMKVSVVMARIAGTESTAKMTSATATATSAAPAGVRRGNRRCTKPTTFAPSPCSSPARMIRQPV
jgi:hypothetical protein